MQDCQNEKALKIVRYQGIPQTSCDLFLTRDSTKNHNIPFNSNIIITMLFTIVQSCQESTVPHKNKTENFLAK